VVFEKWDWFWVREFGKEKGIAVWFGGGGENGVFNLCR
jgi:hypothetical protein